ncbi:MAG: phytoene desaturase family protein, partial [Frankiaceae bacterium]
AARLAVQGHAVTLLEAADQIGGKLGERVRDGFRFDTGPSLLTLPEVFAELFADTGGWPEGLELQRLDPVARYRFADGTGFDAADDPAELRDRLDAALAEAKALSGEQRRVRAGLVGRQLTLR